MNPFVRSKEMIAFIKASSRLHRAAYKPAIDYLNRISDSSHLYRVVLAMRAFAYINVGEPALATSALHELEKEMGPDDAQYRAYIDHLHAVMDNDMKKYWEAIDLYNRSDKDKFVQRHLPLFYPKVHGEPC